MFLKIPLQWLNLLQIFIIINIFLSSVILLQHFIGIIKNSEAILCHCPVGVFEFPNFRYSTAILAIKISDSSSLLIAGGMVWYDSGHRSFGITDKISYISTVVCAFIAFIIWKQNCLPLIMLAELTKHDKESFLKEFNFFFIPFLTLKR